MEWRALIKKKGPLFRFLTNVHLFSFKNVSKFPPVNVSRRLQRAACISRPDLARNVTLQHPLARVTMTAAAAGAQQ